MNFYTKSLFRPRGGMAKILLVMRLIIVLLTTAILQVSAMGYAQKVTLKQNNARLTTVLDEIRRQTGYDFVYSDKVMNTAKPVSLNVTNAELNDALEICFKDQPLSFKVEDKMVIIQPKEPSFLDRAVSAFADINVTGVVVDEESGQALVGASVKVKGSNRATTTASNGAFYLQGVDEDAVIEISFVGFKSVEVKAAKNLGTIKLEVSFSDLNEVEINKGYYTEKRRLSTGSVGRITAEDIAKSPVSNPLAALQGRVSGLVITQSTGMAGGNFNVKIRGQNSLRNLNENDSDGSNANNPLFVVDGVPFIAGSLINRVTSSPSLNPYPASNQGQSPLEAINPADIESIEILKDAEATSIYGSKGSNGVILITTKKGTTGKMVVNANFYAGASKVTRTMSLLNTQQYLEMRREAFRNDGIDWKAPNIIANDLKVLDTTRYTDWQKELIGGTAKSIDGQLSFSGGTQNSQYRFGSGYHRETTVSPGEGDNQRASVSISLSNNSTNQKFKSTIAINYSVGFTKLLSTDLTSIALTRLPHAQSLYNEDGSINWDSGLHKTNPIIYTKRPYNAKSNVLTANTTLSYEIMKGLILKSSFGYTNFFRKDVSKIPISSYWPGTVGALNESMFGNNTNSSWIIEPQLSWSKSFDLSTLNAFVGGSLQDQTGESTSQSAKGFASEALMDNLGSATSANIISGSSFFKYRYVATFGRVGYNYNNKYLINLTGRRDGSSRFGKDKQFGNFGQMSIGWIFSDETFIKRKIPFLSFGKLRSSYGVSGSDQIPNYGYLDAYGGSGQYQGLSGMGPIRLANPDFSWESNRKFETALELGFLNDRVRLIGYFSETIQ